jgi:hypothetical protein
MAEDGDTVELRLARAYRDEAEQHRKAAAADLEAARYERGQADRNLREVQILEKSIAAREQKLRELGFAELVAREQAAAAKLAEAQELMRNYDKSGHAARLAIIAIDERERAEREQSAA